METELAMLIGAAAAAARQHDARLGIEQQPRDFLSGDAELARRPTG